jgi:hypothetical protein
LLPGAHDPDSVAVVDLAIDDFDVRDHALEGVVVRIEDQRPERHAPAGIGRCWHFGDDCFENVIDACPGLRRRGDHLIVQQADELPNFLRNAHRVGIG